MHEAPRFQRRKGELLIQCQAEYTEHQIKLQFKKLRQFLRDKEAARITALREEEEQKKQKMKEKLKEMNRHISALSQTIKDLEEMKKAKDVHLLEKFPVTMERVQISQPDPETPSGALIRVSHYLGNLPYRVWKKMLNSVQKTPVILDPNTAHPRLVLSHDLTRVKFVWDEQPFPDNPERFDICECVLGSKGFHSGTHSWEVEVKHSECWSLGVTTASNQRKGHDCCETDVWCVKYDPYNQLESGFLIEEDLEYVRVDLDYDGGTVSFSDPVTNTHIHTFTTTFTDTIFPIFCNLDELKCLRILPFKLHNVCNECLRQFWKTKESQECPVCGIRPSKNPSCNLVLKTLCKSFLKERNEKHSAGSEEICSLHGKTLKFVCLGDNQPVCSACKHTQKYTNQTLRPICEVVPSYKEELNTALKSLQEKLQQRENIKRELEKTVQHIKSQTEYTEHQIKEQFKKLRQFLRDEEEATITALRKEEKQKEQKMKEKLGGDNESQ
ncbi:E3 ubiquitin-protein ligase TRIM35-like [Labeo rohita]|uniref:E3 ubiquitin-protein ligase TRIM35-like n=1 Tax=Labeo rohita TaxID=84645 RepID=UPI0021E219A3|nr:E3 ubiquitin-protein ligase TRIM35-like [Labeo rohita]